MVLNIFSPCFLAVSTHSASSVIITVLKRAKISFPVILLNPLVTFLNITLGLNACSEELFVGGTLS